MNYDLYSSSTDYSETEIDNNDLQCDTLEVDLSVCPFTFQSGAPQRCPIQIVPITAVRLNIYAVKNVELYSYLYIEKSDCSNCQPRFHVISNTRDCTAGFEDDPSRQGTFGIRFVNVNQTIEIFAVDQNATDGDGAPHCPHQYTGRVVSFDDPTEETTTCNVTEYHDVIEGNTLRKLYQDRGEAYDFDHYQMGCYAQCTCTLEFREWIMECRDGSAFRYLVLYNPGIQHLRYNMGIGVITEDAFKGFQSIVSLSLIKNFITDISPRSFQDCAHLEYLYLRYNYLESLDGLIFWPLIELRDLDLSANQIQNIFNETFATLHKLKWLDLEDI